MSDLVSGSGCNFIFDSGDEEEQEYEQDQNNAENNTMELFNLLNPNILSPFNNLQNDNDTQDLNDQEESQNSEEEEEKQFIDDKNNASYVDGNKAYEENGEPFEDDYEQFVEEEEEEGEEEGEEEERLQNKIISARKTANVENHFDHTRTENMPQESNVIIKKKKKVSKPKQIPQRLLVTKKELNKDIENEGVLNKKTKRKSKKSIKEMIDRLMKQPEPKPLQLDNECDIKPKVQCDLKIFDRLYEMSKEKEKRNEKLRKDIENEEINFSVRKADKSNKKSNELAEQQLISFIESNFSDKTEMKESELAEVLMKLGILDNKEVISKNPALKTIYEEWLIEKENGFVFDAFRVKEAILKSATSNEKTKFDVYARQRMTIALSDIKQKNKNVQPIVPKEDKKIKKETIMRLSKTRETPPQKKQVLPVRPKHIPKKIEEPEGMSLKTQEILGSCDLAHVPFEEREKVIAQKKTEKIEKLDKELHSNRLNVGPQFGMKPQWSSEVQEKLDEYRRKKLNSKANEPSFRPSIISFNKYQKKIRKQMMTEPSLPEGYEESISRHRQARLTAQQKKIEEAKKDPFYELTNIPL